MTLDSGAGTGPETEPEHPGRPEPKTYDDAVAQIARLVTPDHYLRIGETAEGALTIQLVEHYGESEVTLASSEGCLWDCLEAIEAKLKERH